ncbi:DNA-binding MarR family transcriptional regulator [Actinocorallia herbida]|uniref:DNA-binding MarR family transcriptional regulator n=1 Tax=Actinocorallia herbida TaxID=58109 RepID=A0A3N1CXQ3_9ACTN|nr:MarR family winged helix-turn-helix transcriptional regulator [Actinocorallia herbida]ROO86051.1 DNA-binding MarR family transcriptional regulator [Actinocorallia herbida]
MMTGDPTPLTRLKNAPSWLINQAAAHSHRLLTEGFGAADLRSSHYRLLAGLAEHGPASQAELGRRTGIDRSDVVAALNELAGKSLIERAPDPADRRRNVITLTPEGRRRLTELDGVLARIQDDLVAPLSPAEREEFVRLLTRVNDHHAQARTPEPPRAK